MSIAPEIRERHSRILAELADLGLALARQLQVEALAAETPAEAARLAAAFHHVARSVRQSMALEARLLRDGRREDRDARLDAADQRKAAVRTRAAQVRATVARLIWNEHEADEAEDVLEDLEEHLEAISLSDGFLEGPIEAQIAAICEELGLPAPPPRPAGGPGPKDSSVVHLSPGWDDPSP